MSRPRACYLVLICFVVSLILSWFFLTPSINEKVDQKIQALKDANQLVYNRTSLDYSSFHELLIAVSAPPNAPEQTLSKAESGLESHGLTTHPSETYLWLYHNKKTLENLSLFDAFLSSRESAFPGKIVPYPATLPFKNIFNVGRLLRADLANSLATGNRQKVFICLIRTKKFLEAIQSGPGLYWYSVGIALEEGLTEPICNAIDTADLTVEQLQQIGFFYKEKNNEISLERALTEERALQVEWFKKLLSDAGNQKASGKISLKERIKNRVNTPLLSQVLNAENHYLDYVEGLFNALAMDSPRKFEGLSRERVKLAKLIARTQSIVSSTVSDLLKKSCPDMYSLALRDEKKLRQNIILRCLISLKLYHATHDSYPENLTNWLIENGFPLDLKVVLPTTEEKGAIYIGPDKFILKVSIQFN